MNKIYNIPYEEIYYSSTQKSAVSGSIGFGVRTYTTDMPTNEVNEIAGAFSPTYPVPTAHRVTQAQLVQSPEIVLDYPISYEYRMLTLGDGTKRYVIARTVYVGIEYGYFCNGNAKRAGSNFFTHMLIFRQEPPFALLKDIVEGRVCMPQNGICTPENPEWQMLLTGEPQLLQRHESIEHEENDDTSWVKDQRFITLAKALLQAHTNEKLGKDPMLQKVMVKTTMAESKELVKLMSHMPDSVLALFPFSSNIMQGSMPNNYRLAMVNEWNTTQQYTNNYVYVDFTNNAVSNIEQNFLFEKIDELSAAGDAEKVTKLMAYYLNVDFSNQNEYPFVYDIFLSVQTPVDLPLAKIDNIFIDKTIQLALPEDDAAKLWAKINATFKASLLQMENGNTMVNAIHMIHYCRQKGCPLLHIDQETVDTMTSLFFDSDTNLKNFSTKCSPEMILPLVNLRNVSEERFFSVLRNCNLTSYWSTFVKHYYGNDLSKQLDRLMGEMVATNQLAENDREQLREVFFPLSNNWKEILHWFVAHPDAIKPYKATAITICAAQEEETFSLLINASDACKKEVAEILAPTAISYYKKRMEAKKGETSRLLAALCNRISANTFCHMGLDNIFKMYVDHAFVSPSKIKLETIETILALKLQATESNALTRLEHIRAIMKGEVVTNVNFEDLKFEIDRGGSNRDYKAALFVDWIKGKRRERQEVISYCDLIDWRSISKNEHKNYIVAIWNSKMESQAAIDTIMYIIHLAGWKKEDIAAFISYCNGSIKLADLGTAVQKENSFFRKLKRFFKRLGKKK